MSFSRKLFYLNNHFVNNFWDNYRFTNEKVDIDTKTKTIER